MSPFDASLVYRVAQSPAVSPSISPQAVASPDPWGRFFSIQDSFGRCGAMHPEQAESVAASSVQPQRPALAAMRPCDTASRAASPHRDAPTPAQLAADSLQYQALREAAAAQLQGLVQYFSADGRAADVALSVLHKRCQAMTSGVRSGTSPFCIEWDGQLKTGSVVAFLQWVVAQPMSQVVHALRMSCVAATATQLTPSLHRDGMVDPKRSEPAYTLCSLIAGIFAADERAQASMYRHVAAEDANRLLATLYFRGPRQTLAKLQHSIVHIEAHRAVALLTARQTDIHTFEGFAAVVAKALNNYCQQGGSINDALFEVGAKAHRIEAFKRALVFYKAEGLVERAFAADVSG